MKQHWSRHGSSGKAACSAKLNRQVDITMNNMSAFKNVLGVELNRAAMAHKWSSNGAKQISFSSACQGIKCIITVWSTSDTMEQQCLHKQIIVHKQEQLISTIMGMQLLEQVQIQNVCISIHVVELVKFSMHKQADDQVNMPKSFKFFLSASAM